MPAGLEQELLGRRVHGLAEVLDVRPEADELLGGDIHHRAADALQLMGYRNVISVDGGFRAYKEAGKEMEGGSVRTS